MGTGRVEDTVLCQALSSTVDERAFGLGQRTPQKFTKLPRNLVTG